MDVCKSVRQEEVLTLSDASPNYDDGDDDGGGDDNDDDTFFHKNRTHELDNIHKKNQK